MTSKYTRIKQERQQSIDSAVDVDDESEYKTQIDPQQERGGNTQDNNQNIELVSVSQDEDAQQRVIVLDDNEDEDDEETFMEADSLPSDGSSSTTNRLVFDPLVGGFVVPVSDPSALSQAFQRSMKKMKQSIQQMNKQLKQLQQRDRHRDISRDRQNDHKQIKTSQSKSAPSTSTSTTLPSAVVSASQHQAHPVPLPSSFRDHPVLHQRCLTPLLLLIAVSLLLTFIAVLALIIQGGFGSSTAGGDSTCGGSTGSSGLSRSYLLPPT